MYFFKLPEEQKAGERVVENNLGASRSVLLTSPDLRYESSGSVLHTKGKRNRTRTAVGS
jgi:hypothetical protein